MSAEVFYPIEDAEQLIAAFEDGSLDRDEWDHGAHLVVGLYYVAKYGKNAYPEIKKRIQYYNACHNNDGYHDTMTRFWADAIPHFRGDENGKVLWTQTALDDLIFDDNLTRRNLWIDYYSEEVMLSKAAREGYIAPDIQSF